MEDCLFCQIARNEVPADKIYEDNKYTAFLDINPQAPVHILIIPKKHVGSVENLDEDDKELVGGLFLVAQEVARKKGINEDGYRLIANVGPDGGQIIKHLHLHLLGGKNLGPKIVI